MEICEIISHQSHDSGCWLTHWGRVTHICVSKLTIIASDNGLSPGRRQAIIWTSAGILLIGPLGTQFSEILIEIILFSFKKVRLKVSSAKWRPCCLGLNVKTQHVAKFTIVPPPHYHKKLPLSLILILVHACNESQNLNKGKQNTEYMSVSSFIRYHDN